MTFFTWSVSSADHSSCFARLLCKVRNHNFSKGDPEHGSNVRPLGATPATQVPGENFSLYKQGKHTHSNKNFQRIEKALQIARITRNTRTNLPSHPDCCSPSVMRESAKAATDRHNTAKKNNNIHNAR